MKFLKSAKLQLGTLHGFLRGDNQYEVAQTTIATKLLVCRYPLSNNRVSGRKRDIRPLCGDGEEDEMHFLLMCRPPYVAKLLEYCQLDKRSIDPENLTKVINSHDLVNNPEIRKLCKDLMYQLQCMRAKILSHTKPPVLVQTIPMLDSGSPD